MVKPRFLNILALVGCATILGAAPAASQTTGDTPAPFVEVSRTSEVSVDVDRAQVRFAVETRTETAAEAASQNADRMDAVIRALRELGIEGTRIETSGYQLSPVYRRPERGESQGVIDGYQALNHVVLTLDDVERVGAAIDAGIAAGANRVAGLQFEARNTEAARMEAVRLAVRKARAEAEAMADALGLTLGHPLEVRGGAHVPGPRPQPYARMESMAMDQGAPTPVEPGEQIVRASVTVKFLLHTDR